MYFSIQVYLKSEWYRVIIKEMYTQGLDRA